MSGISCFIDDKKITNDLEYFNTNELLNDVDEVGRLLESYMQGIKRNTNS